jgi:diacylglycerol kinase
MMNSVMERFCDMVTTGFHPKIKVIKDVAAGAVLVAALFSLIIGLVIFIPALTGLFTHVK